MGSVTVTYSHAAPYIREALVTACRQAADSRTIRSRREYIGQAYGLARALQIMAEAEDQTPVEGVHEPGGFHDSRGYGYVRRFLGSDHEFEETMRIPAVASEPWPWDHMEKTEKS